MPQRKIYTEGHFDRISAARVINPRFWKRNISDVFYWQYLISNIFLVSLKLGACDIRGQWVEFKIKNPILFFHILFCHFVLFFLIKFVSLSFLFYFFFVCLMEYQIYTTKYLPIRNVNQRQKLVAKLKTLSREVNSNL